MSRRKRILLAVGLLVVVAVAGVVAVQWVMPAAGGKSWGDFQRIAVGMRRPDVEAILGAFSGVEFGPGQPTYVWSDDEARIYVSFDGDSRVVKKTWDPVQIDPLTRLRHWLGL